MTSTPDQAIDEMLTVFKTAWDSNLLSTGISVVYEGVAKEIPNGSDPWVYVSVQHSDGGEANLFGSDTTRRYRNLGFLVFSIYTPFGDGLDLADNLAQVITDTFMGSTPHSVTYITASPTYVGQVGSWYMTNTIVEFRYDTIR